MDAQQQQQQQQRLFIRQVVMENFKSYAGEQVVGPFHKSFSAVVGPNGSGKSNVIDAMLFVFGKRAKQMRLNKVSELIHNSTNHQNLDKARVSVYFQEISDLDDDDHRVVPGSDFVITRVAFRDNSSKYYINDKSSNFTEVTKKLKAKGVDLDNNRFLILQGEVEQISLMKPKSQGQHDEGFLEYLEDIIGSNKYVEKIEEAEKKLELINEKRGNMVNRVKIAKQEKDNLEGPKDEAMTYLLKEVELFKWRGKSLELGLVDAETNASKLRQAVIEQEENLETGRMQLAEHLKIVKDLEATYNRQNKGLQELDRDLKKCTQEFKEFERQDTKYREDIKHLKQKLKKIDERIIKDTSKIEEIEKENQESIVIIPKLEEDVIELSQQHTNEEKTLDQIKESSKGEIENYQEQLAVVRVELEPWEKQIIDCQGKIDLASSERKLLKEKHEAAKKAYEKAQDQIKEIQQQIVAKERELQNIDGAIKKNKQLIYDSQSVEKVHLAEKEGLTPLEQAAKQKLSELCSVLEAEKSQGSVLRAILQAKESGQIEGIYGRLGDLGAIESKYDVAISTACGGLEYIVVETASAAQACVELLRSKNLGVATFLILEKQNAYFEKMRQRVKTPEGVPRLFDLVTVKDERLRVAFFAMLGNTVVAKDLNQATRIAYGADKEFRRVVSLDGAVFEKSGTMTGGGGKPQGGRMGTSIRACSVASETISLAEQELRALSDRIIILNQSIEAAVRQYKTAEKSVAELDLSYAKTQMEIEGLRVQNHDVEKQLASLRDSAELKRDEVCRTHELDEIIKKEGNEMIILNMNSKKMKDKAAELQRKIENAGGENLQRQKSIVEKLQTDIDKKRTEINRRKVQITSGNKTILKLKKGLEEAEKEKTKCLSAKEIKSSEFKEIEKKAFVVKDTYENIQRVIERRREDMESTMKDYNERKRIVDELRTGEVDVQFKLEDTKRIAKDWEMKVKGYQKKLEETNIDMKRHIEQILKEDIGAELVQQALTREELERTCDVNTANDKVGILEAQLKQLKPSLDSITEYRRKAAAYNERMDELNIVNQERDEVKREHDDLRNRRLDEFMEGFNIISLKLKEMYQMITLGGDAELELVDSLDPFAEGVVFSVRPPKKSWKSIANLSGGEKTLSSLAFVFALHHYKPTPLYVMDEIDAALDFKNVSIVGHYIKDRTKDAQFVVISLRNNMFELADRLVGIYKTENCTKSITINPKSFAISAAEGA